MNAILTVSYILSLPTVILGKTIPNFAESEVNGQSEYALNYAVTEPLSGDNKAQWENKYGDKVNEAYSLVEPDENYRIVEYTSDDINGFSALVKTLADTLNSPQPDLKSLFIPLPDYALPDTDSLPYGFGAANLAIDIPNVKLSGSSLPWDPKTGSFGGWIPIRRPAQRSKPKATIMRKKYVNRHLSKVVYKPISLPNKSVILIRKT